ncbi:MAG TPA: hypothetical protein VNM68_07860, partial [Candidatus Polarisedimenticolia bacterium]|nr:hypothetical protein [Candidatus Polarisedimenticolia bacterium]
LARSLVFSAGSAAFRMEEAAVALGTDRLRVLVYMWSLLSDGRHAEESLETGEFHSTGPAGGPPTLSEVFQAWNTEALYLACFQRWLGLESLASVKSREKPPCFAAGLQSEDMPRLTALLIRDFVALIPVLDPAISRLRQQAVGAEASSKPDK